MTIILYDDHSFVMDAIAKHESRPIHAIILSHCTTIKETISAVAKYKPDILIADIISPENSGTSLFDTILKDYPKVKIIAYSTITNHFLIQCLLDMGVSKVIHKSTNIDALWEEVAKTYQQKKISIKNLKPPYRLTEREKSICELLLQGLSAGEIGLELGTSTNTINNQKNILLQKFECKNSTELIVKLSQLGLISII